METTSEPWGLSALISLVPPALYVGLAVFTMLLFRDPLSAALKRLSKFSTPFASMEAASGPQEAQQSTTTSATDAAKAAAQQGRVGQLRWVPGAPVQEPITETWAFMKGTKPRDDTADLAIFWYVSWLFETIYRIIWGTQIDLLRAVDARGSISKADAESFFKTSQQRGNKGQTFEQYMQYLVSQEFVKPSEDASSYSRTQLGHQFLVYLTSQSVIINRPL